MNGCADSVCTASSCKHSSLPELTCDIDSIVNVEFLEWLLLYFSSDSAKSAYPHVLILKRLCDDKQFRRFAASDLEPQQVDWHGIPSEKIAGDLGATDKVS